MFLRFLDSLLALVKLTLDEHVRRRGVDPARLIVDVLTTTADSRWA
jgi:hypothetical protein